MKRTKKWLLITAIICIIGIIGSGVIQTNGCSTRIEQFLFSTVVTTTKRKCSITA